MKKRFLLWLKKKKKTDVWYLVQKRKTYYTIAIEDITAEQLTDLLGY